MNLHGMKEVDGTESSQTPAPPSVVDDTLTADVTTRAPSQAAVSKALAMKQGVIASSDEIKEGKDHLYFTEVRALDAVSRHVYNAIDESVAKKQDEIVDSDEIKEGQKNQYFKPERALAAVSEHVRIEIEKAIEANRPIIEKPVVYTDAQAMEAAKLVCPTKAELAVALLEKQISIKSSDDISEGLHHKYFKKEVVSEMIESVCKDFVEYHKFLSKKIEALQAEVDQLKPKWSDAFSGGNAVLTVITNVSHHGVRTQTLRFKDGALFEISPKTSLKAISSEDV